MSDIEGLSEEDLLGEVVWGDGRKIRKTEDKMSLKTKRTDWGLGELEPATRTWAYSGNLEGLKDGDAKTH